MKRNRTQNERHGVVDRLANGKDVDVQTFIKEGGDVNLQDNYNMTLLHHAVEKRNLVRAKILVEAKCLLNLFDKQENTPLMMSVHRNQFDMTKFLLENGAKTDTRNSSDNTPLSVAVWNRNKALVGMLLKYGADCNVMCNVYMDRFITSSPVIYCVKHKYFDILQCIKQSGQVNLSKQLMICHEHLCLEQFSYFLSKGADPFQIVNLSPTYGISRIRHVFDRVLAEVMQNHHIFGFGAKTCQNLIRECGCVTSSYNENDILRTLLTCNAGPSALDYYEKHYANFAVEFLKYIANLGISYHNYPIYCHCRSDFHDRRTCPVIGKLRATLQDPDVQQALYQGFVIPLQHQCRRSIRTTLRYGVVDKIDKLPLPSLIKMFLKFSGELEMPRTIFCGKAH
ncbi:hypothetical protein FSP39_022399 [Pinctada imbricata]|uniref:SOCS box domain-containing protein n=1 Tax=Pinctada imbricata TaxID=66713 RepID=A0AA88YG27_PINIB|nr:hypothetical protein FSP39_022399 [Pinctada imbricata]